MIIGSHNTVSFLKAKQWYLRPFAWMARCQKADLHDQFFKYDVRYFDIRIKFTKAGYTRLMHGAIVWDGYLYDILNTLNKYAECIDEPTYVRLILEQNFKSADQAFQNTKFKETCSYCATTYKNLVFVGGRRKYDWEKLYDFGTEEPTLDDKYSSTTHPFGGKKDSIWAKIDDFWPWLYAKTHNKKHYKEGTTKDILFLDFVNIK